MFIFEENVLGYSSGNVHFVWNCFPQIILSEDLILACIICILLALGLKYVCIYCLAGAVNEHGFSNYFLQTLFGTLSIDQLLN